MTPVPAPTSTSAQRSALTSLRRIPAMKRNPAITASRRPRSAVTSSDSRPRPRRRGLVAGGEDGGNRDDFETPSWESDSLRS